MSTRQDQDDTLCDLNNREKDMMETKVYIQRTREEIERRTQSLEQVRQDLLIKEKDLEKLMGHVQKTHEEIRCREDDLRAAHLRLDERKRDLIKTQQYMDRARQDLMREEAIKYEQKGPDKAGTDLEYRKQAIKYERQKLESERACIDHELLNLLDRERDLAGAHQGP